MMPKDSSAKAVDVSVEFIKRDGSFDIYDDPDALLVAAYDITISNGKQEYQPDDDKPVYVEISDPKLCEENCYELWHIHDNGKRK